MEMLERNATEVGFADNLVEYRVPENRQELVGIERHCSNLSNRLYRVGADCSRGSRVGPGIICRGRKSVSDGAFLEDITSAPELSVGGEGACWTGLVVSVGGGGGAVCVSLAEGDALSSPELTVGADGDAVD